MLYRLNLSPSFSELLRLMGQAARLLRARSRGVFRVSPSTLPCAIRIALSKLLSLATCRLAAYTRRQHEAS